MAEHECTQIAHIAQIAERQVAMQEAQGKWEEEVKANFNKILEVLQGNGKPGLKTDVEMLKQSHQRLVGVVKWVFSGSGLVVTGYILKGLLEGFK